MKTYSFTFVLADLDTMTDDLANELFEAGCDDATAHSENHQAFVAFDRDSESLEEAIRSALADIEKAGVTVAHVQLDAEDLGSLNSPISS